MSKNMGLLKKIYDKEQIISFRLHEIFITRFLEFEKPLKEFKKLKIMTFREKDIPYFQGILHVIQTDLRKKKKVYFGKADDEISVRQLKDFINLINKHKILNLHIDQSL